MTMAARRMLAMSASDSQPPVVCVVCNGQLRSERHARAPRRGCRSYASRPPQVHWAEAAGFWSTRIRRCPVALASQTIVSIGMLTGAYSGLLETCVPQARHWSNRHATAAITRPTKASPAEARLGAA
jgi:hypothetical protein